MKPDVKKIIADIKATKGNRKYCNGLAGTLQDDNYVSSICKYVKTVTPERIDLLIEYTENLEAEVTDMAVQLANAESKCRELAAENAKLADCANFYRLGFKPVKGAFGIEYRPTEQLLDDCGNTAIEAIKTPATDSFLAEVRASAIPEGYVLVPKEMHLSAEAMEGICFHCGDGGFAFGEFTDGLLFVGAIDDSDGQKIHGLHIATADYPEEGCATICEFLPSPIQGAAQ